MIKLALSFVLALAVTSPAEAQVKPDAAPARFDVADANDDGKVDRTEYGNFVAERVLLLDTDGDGKLARSEVASAPDPGKFDKVDSNGDGFLVIEELDVYTDSDFSAMDTNGDGTIDRAEAAQEK